MTTTAPADRDRFLRDAEAYRRELVAHCYKMVGSTQDAEDLVQETLLRAWRSYDSFEGRSSVRTWLYRIATNLCLTSLGHSQRRVLPSGLGAAADDGTAPMSTAAADVLWIDPIPTSTVEVVGSADPADVVAARSGLRLALIASLQHLPPRQRATLLLREALGYSAKEIGELLDMTPVAVKSALQRARATLDEAKPTAESLAEPTSREARAVLDRYMDAFERADVEAMNELLRAEASLELVPSDTWFKGKRTCLAQLRLRALTTPGLYRMFATTANDQPAAVVYRRDTTAEAFRPFGVVALDVVGGGIAAIRTFADPSLVARFGFPEFPDAVQSSR